MAGRHSTNTHIPVALSPHFFFFCQENKESPALSGLVVGHLKACCVFPFSSAVWLFSVDFTNTFLLLGELSASWPLGGRVFGKTNAVHSSTLCLLCRQGFCAG